MAFTTVSISSSKLWYFALAWFVDWLKYATKAYLQDSCFWSKIPAKAWALASICSSVSAFGLQS